MATINAPSLQDTVYSGDCPLAVAHGYVTLASAAIADKVRLNKVYAGTKIYDVKMVNAALGASTTIALGYEYINGEAGGAANALLAATATNTANTTRQSGNIPPVTLDYDAYITATVAGGTASGQLNVITTYEFKGK